MNDSATPDEIRRLEAIARDAWPPEQVVRHEGWRLYVSEGGTRRARAVYPEAEERGALTDRIAHCRRFYAEQGLRCVFKLTSASAPSDLDATLERLGWKRSGETCVQTRALAAGRAAEAGPSVRVAAELDDEWLARCIELRGDVGQNARAHAGIIERIVAMDAPSGLAGIRLDGRVAAIGLAVVASGHVFVADVATDPSHRGRGLARSVVAGLLDWGAAQGAVTGLLQVVADNAPALRLYAGLGFETRYRYWYREAPDGDRE